VGFQTFEEKKAITPVAVLNAASGTGVVTLTNPGYFATRVDALTASNSSATAHDVIVSIGNGGNEANVAVVSVPALAGHSAAVPVVDLLAGLPSAMTGVIIDYSSVLHAHLAVALTGGDTIVIAVQGGDF
jgi:hypothetical protein